MSTPLASTTILHGASKQDVAVPVGTTVAKLMNMLHIDADADSLRVTHADGTPVDLGLAFGSDLASGVVLTLSGPTENERVAQQVAIRAVSPWFRPTLVLSLFLALVASIEVACLAGPAFGWWPVAEQLRRASAVICVIALSWSLRWWRLRCTAAGILATTTLIGVCGTVLLSTDMDFLPQLTVAATAWTALVAALLVWLIDRSALSATMAALWGLTGVVISSIIMTDAPATMIAAPVLAVTTMSVATIPTFSFRVPETQLLDLSAVTTSAPAVRTPDVAPPTPITTSRVIRSVHDAEQRGQLLLIVCCGVIAIVAFPAAQLLKGGDWTTITGSIMMVSAFLALVLLPRSRRDRLGRVLPRVPALLLVIAALTAFGTSQPLGAQATALIIIIAAASLSILATVLAKASESALLGRIADLTQGLSLFILLPTAVYAAGLFDLIRQAAS